MATNLYITRIITLGTLISIYLSTSDEMLIIMLSKKVEITLILKILLIKIFFGIIYGVIIDKILNNINKASKKWKYQYFYENYSTEDWKNSVLKNIDDWDNVLKLLKTNMDDKKIARLKHSHLVY